MTANTPKVQVHNLQLRNFHIPLTLHRLPGEHPVALILPALGVPAVKYSLLMESLAARGYHSAICELPGTGESHPQPGRAADYGYNDLVFEWIPLALAALRGEFGKDPVLVLGHSIGGQTATLAARAGLTGNAQVVSVAAGHLDSRSWRGLKRAAVVGAAVAAHASTRLLGYFPGKQLRFGGREASTLMRDWGNGIIRGRFTPESRIPQAAALQHQPLHLCIERDPFAPLNATRRLAALVGGEVRLIPATYHKGNPHLSWIRNPDPVLEIVQRRLDESAQDAAVH
ncbi:alpha/beta fold hydrolase [Microbulbifer bruguierae]|uniref:Alpha/beta fold hydrolase n=1 Tax=Microbulbifer bruguierae TaxID=3029061 RepID=A0ABY8N9F5_9GAMM|nr:alpha/beta fold hydrolase [Microbulbifer bruguierae]WGL15064.1 alpha/beta fold hydrolase [Microbulbifer bruguierae]